MKELRIFFVIVHGCRMPLANNMLEDELHVSCHVNLKTSW